MLLALCVCVCVCGGGGGGGGGVTGDRWIPLTEESAMQGASYVVTSHEIFFLLQGYANLIVS